MSCVRPGVLLTNARRRRPVRVLIALDLPAFERPAKAISGARSPEAPLPQARGDRLAVKSAGFPWFSFLFFSRGPRMRVFTGFAGLMALVYASIAAAAPAPAAKPDIERGKQIATTVCAACHGVNGVSPAPTNPHLAGQHGDYIALQLAAFKSGARPSPIMHGMAAGVSPAGLSSVGGYFENQKAS